MARKQAETKPEKPAKARPAGKTEAKAKQAKPAEKAEGKRKRAKTAEPLTTAEWRKIRLEYVRGKTTYQRLADKYGISASNIRKRASKEGWRKKKNKLDTQVEQKVLERVCDARAREFELIAAVNDRMGEVLDNLLQFVTEQPPKKYDDLRGVESLSKAIAQVVQTKRDLYNVPSEIDRARIESLREKAKLEREKFAEEQAEKAASKAAAENTMIRVVIEGTEEEMDLSE